MSSNKEMEAPFDHFNGVKRVSAPEGLYDGILQKIGEQERNTLPKHWVWAAAAVFACLLTVEVRLVLKGTSTEAADAIEQIAPMNNNHLYHE